MKSTAEIKQNLINCLPLVQSNYQVKRLGIFGSYIRNEQTADSDLDVLVEFEQNARFGLLKFCELENYLSDKIGIKVDLVMKDGLKPRIGDRILQEVEYL